MTTNKTILKLFAAVLVVASVTSCEKPPGPGGKATIKGKVYAYDWDNTQRYLVSDGYSAGDKVYIIYGDNNSVGNDVRTSYDGSFEFRNLNKGSYKIFVNSLDTASKFKGNDTEIPVVREVKINSAGQSITLDDFIINK